MRWDSIRKRVLGFRFFILLDHLKETVHRLANGFGAGSPLDYTGYKGPWVNRSPHFWCEGIPCRDWLRIDTGLIEKSLCQFLMDTMFGYGMVGIVSRRIRSVSGSGRQSPWSCLGTQTIGRPSSETRILSTIRGAGSNRLAVGVEAAGSYVPMKGSLKKSYLIIIRKT